MLTEYQTRPAHIPEDVYTLARSVWEQVLPQADRRYAQEREALQAATAQAQRQAGEAQARETDTAARAAAQAEALETAREQVRQLAQQLTAEQARREQAESRIDGARIQAQQAIEQADLQVVAVKEHLTLAETRFEAAEKRLVGQLDGMQQQRDAAHTALQRQTAEWKTERDEFVKRTIEHEKALARRHAEWENATAALTESNTRLDRQLAHTQTLETTVTQLNHSLNTLEKRVATLEAERKALVDERESLLEQKAHAEHLETEKQLLAEQLKATQAQLNQLIRQVGAAKGRGGRRGKTE